MCHFITNSFFIRFFFRFMSLFVNLMLQPPLWLKRERSCYGGAGCSIKTIIERDYETKLVQGTGSILSFKMYSLIESRCIIDMSSHTMTGSRSANLLILLPPVYYSWMKKQDSWEMMLHSEWIDWFPGRLIIEHICIANNNTNFLAHSMFCNDIELYGLRALVLANAVHGMSISLIGVNFVFDPLEAGRILNRQHAHYTPINLSANLVNQCVI